MKEEVDIILAYLDEMCCNRMAGIRLAVSLNGNGLSFVGVKIHGKDSSYIIWRTCKSVSKGLSWWGSVSGIGAPLEIGAA